MAGVADALDAAGIAVFGPTKAAARLEGSKGFTKELARDYAIPTARYGWFDEAAIRQAASPERCLIPS